MLLVPPNYGATSKPLTLKLKDIIDWVGNSGLCVCVDAGEPASYSSGQQWSDVSGNGNHYWRGDDGNSGTDDAAFNGAAGSLSSYFSFDGGDYFTPTSNWTYDDPFHRDGGTFTLVTSLYVTQLPSGSSWRQIIQSTVNVNSGTTGQGLVVQFDGPNGGRLSYTNHNGSGYYDYPVCNTVPPLNQWFSFALSVSENGGGAGSHWNFNGTIQTFNGDRPSPAGGNPQGSLSISHQGTNSGNRLLSGTRIGCLGIYNRALSPADTTKIIQQLKLRGF